MTNRIKFGKKRCYGVLSSWCRHAATKEKVKSSQTKGHQASGRSCIHASSIKKPVKPITKPDILIRDAKLYLNIYSFYTVYKRNNLQVWFSNSVHSGKYLAISSTFFDNQCF
jgi:hypothetical protein